MIGEKRLREVLNRSILEESKDDGSGYLESIQRKLASLRKTVNESANSSNNLSMMNQNRISKDRFGNELSRISRGVEADLSSLDSQDRNDIESCRLTVQGDTSIVRTELSERDHEEEYKTM